MKKLLCCCSVSFVGSEMKPLRYCALALFFVCVSTFISVGQLQLLKDIDQSKELQVNEYSWLTNAGTYMYFVSNGELWMSNGTTKGTRRMKSFTSIANLTMSGETLYFTADDGKTGSELWKSNGSPRGTVKVKDIVRGGEGSSPAYLTDVKGTLFFAAQSAGKGIELWKSDGTSAGTVLVKDIARGSANPRHLVNFNGTLFFTATGPTGYELWKSNGTSANTLLIKDIIAGPQSSNPALLTVSNNLLFFVALHPRAGRELWISDGTTAGTRLLKDIRRGTRTSAPENLIHANGKLMFTANNGISGDELWASNGTPGGTTLVKDMNPGPAGSNNTNALLGSMGNFTNINGILYFIAAKGDQDYIYRSDGTERGTIIVTPAVGFTVSKRQPEFTYRDGYVYFFNSEEPYEGYFYSLYKMPYKGKAITHVKDVGQNTALPIHKEMISMNGALYFPGRLDGGYELIRSDGTSEGTVAIHDTFITTTSSDFPEMISSGGNVYSLHFFTNIPDWVPTLYSTDGTPGGTFKIVTGDRTSKFFTDWEQVGDHLYLMESVHTPVSGWQLSKTKGTPETTSIIASGAGGDFWMTPKPLANVNGTLYFISGVGEVWKTDGTASGTVMLGDLSTVHTITNVNGQVFILTGGLEGLQLWKSENDRLIFVTTLPNTSIRTSRVSDQAISVGGILYILARESTGYYVWRSDGTAAGTFRMFEAQDPLFGPGPDNINAEVLLRYNDRLYLSNGDVLFETSDDAYTKVADIPMIIKYAEFHDKLFLLTSETAFELHVTDGTSQGTVLLHSREADDRIDYAIAGDYLYFNTIFFSDLWRTDGTPCGTTVVDVGADAPYALEAIGDDLVFGGFKPKTGKELYVYRNVNSITKPPCEDAVTAVGEDGAGARQQQILTPYPNPFADSFTIQITGVEGATATAIIHTGSGAPVETLNDLPVNEPYAMGSGWDKGYYIVKVRSGDQLNIYHVVKN